LAETPTLAIVDLQSKSQQKLEAIQEDCETVKARAVGLKTGLINIK
jgi:hypothetical protein